MNIHESAAVRSALRIHSPLHDPLAILMISLGGCDIPFNGSLHAFSKLDGSQTFPNDSDGPSAAKEFALRVLKASAARQQPFVATKLIATPSPSFFGDSK